MTAAARGVQTMVSAHVDSTTVLNMMRQDRVIRKPISEEQVDERMQTVSLYKSARMFVAVNKHEDCQLGRAEFAPLMQYMVALSLTTLSSMRSSFPRSRAMFSTSGGAGR